MPKYAIGLGSNLGARLANLSWGIRGLDRIGRRLATSSVYESAPVGGPQGQGAYLNQAVLLETPLSPRAVLQEALAVERSAGRVRTVRNGPRTLDIDILLASSGPAEEPGLSLPHPRLWERAFVVEPLAECLETVPWTSPEAAAVIARAQQNQWEAPARRLGDQNLSEDPFPLEDLAVPVLQAANTAERFGRDLESWRVIPSTNDRLKAWARDGAPEGAVVVADHQEQGKGRLGRTWFSPSGSGLYVSVLLRPQAAELGGVLSLLAGLAVNEAIAAVLGPGRAEPRLKWPNDVLLTGKKCAGVLVEAGLDPAPWVVTGIGINMAGDLSEFPEATSLAAATGQPWPRQVVLGKLLGRWEHWIRVWREAGNGPVVRAWSRQSATLGQSVAIYDPMDPVATRLPLWQGLAESVDEEGGLWVRSESGTRRRFLAGEVSLRVVPE